MKVVKYSGIVVDYEPDKLKKSLLKSGANLLEVNNILNGIQSQLYEGISTKQIYKMAFGLLKKASNSKAARYNLRTAIQMLGPDGFLFEKFISKLFIAEGQEAKTNLVLQGHCVSHEVDVAIAKDQQVAMVECKFHGRRDVFSDVKVPMYILSRFNDLKENKHVIFSRNDTLTKCWIITNNRFTTDAIAFGNCMGMHLLSWDYPKENSLKNKIDTLQLYPITCLTTLTSTEKNKLLLTGTILVSEMKDNLMSLQHLGLSPVRIKNVFKEVSDLCTNTKNYES